MRFLVAVHLLASFYSSDRFVSTDIVTLKIYVLVTFMTFYVRRTRLLLLLWPCVLCSFHTIFMAAVWNTFRLVVSSSLWLPCVADADIIFCSCAFFLSFFLSSTSSFPRLISAVGDWMSTILRHMMWP